MYEILSFCSAMLGLFVALPLMALRRQRSANFWIGAFVLSISLLSFASTDFYNSNPALFGLLDWPVTCIGAFYYCYVRALVGLGNGRRQIWHFVPLLAFFGVVLWTRLVLHRNGLPFNFGIFLLGCQSLSTAYALASLYRLRGYGRQLRQSYSATQNRDLAWLRSLTMVVIALLAMWIPATLLGGSWLWLLVTGRAAILFFVGWYGMRQAIVFLPLKETATAAVPVPVPEAQTPAPASARAEADDPDISVEAAELGKYARSGMTEAAQKLIGERLVRRMSQQRDYLESDLTLTDLAERLGTSPQLLSQYLNNTLGLSFFDYINGLRIAEVQRMMCDPVHGDTTLLDLAFAAGFNSKSTFNASFRKISGTAPSHWRKLHAKTSEPIS